MEEQILPIARIAKKEFEDFLIQKDIELREESHNKLVSVDNLLEDVDDVDEIYIVPLSKMSMYDPVNGNEILVIKSKDVSNYIENDLLVTAQLENGFLGNFFVINVPWYDFPEE